MPDPPSRQRQRNGTLLRVKSGCKTCRLRKVKCDESRPACRRCISAGRDCGGYGIWGGGGGIVSHTGPATGPLGRTHDCSKIPRAPSQAPVSGWADQDRHLFDWFRIRTLSKLPGSFISEFWTTLVLQTSLAEPAVLHAVLALGAIHRGGILDGGAVSLPHREQSSALRHYTRAINHLKPHLASDYREKGGLRVTLIACVVFISLELLSGNFEVASLHLRNGLSILRGEQGRDDDDDPVLRVDAHGDLIDDWLIEAFQRLQLQVQLLNGPGLVKPTIFRTVGPEVPPVRFRTFKDAWKDLEVLMNKILHEEHRGRLRHDNSSGAAGAASADAATVYRCEQIKAGLSRWLDLYTVFRRGYRKPTSTRELKALLLLVCYHNMAGIMVEASLRPDDEMVFDDFTPQFLRLLGDLIELREISKESVIAQKLEGGHGGVMETTTTMRQSLEMDMTGSIIDLGWIAPLYYLATKCRNHRIRLHAVRLLRTTSHREGMYDASSAYEVVQKVMQIEEDGFFDGLLSGQEEDFDLDVVPTEQDVGGMPALPDERRLRRLRVLLLGTPMDRIRLMHSGVAGQGVDKVFLAEYIVKDRVWVP